MIDVSIVIPVFNSESSLGACLDGIGRQDCQTCHREVIVVDNNSTDASMAIAARYPFVQLAAEPKQSAYAARNRGISAATGRLIAFTDPDCAPRPDWLRRLTECITDSDARVVMGRDRPAGPTTAVRLLGEYDHRKEVFVMDSADPAIYYGHTNNLIARREAFDHVGLFDERARGSDVIFVHRILSRYGTGAVKYQPDAVVDHLEIRSAAAYFRKAFIYGRSGHRYSSVVRSRPLRHAERMHIFRDTVASAGLSQIESGYLFALLVAGVTCYEAGWRTCWQ